MLEEDERRHRDREVQRPSIGLTFLHYSTSPL